MALTFDFQQTGISVFLNFFAEKVYHRTEFSVSIVTMTCYKVLGKETVVVFFKFICHLHGKMPTAGDPS